MFFKKKVKESNESVGFFDSRPFSYLKEGLEYAKERLVVETEHYTIHTRVYENVLFKVVLVTNFVGFDISKTKLGYLKENNMLTEEEINANMSISIYVIENKNHLTIDFARENTFLANNGYQLVLVYNKEIVGLDYYNALPEFNFHLMKYLRTVIFFDLACHDKEDY